MLNINLLDDMIFFKKPTPKPVEKPIVEEKEEKEI